MLDEAHLRILDAVDIALGWDLPDAAFRDAVVVATETIAARPQD